MALPDYPVGILAGVVLAVLGYNTRGRWRSARKKQDVGKLQGEIEDRKKKITESKHDARRLFLSAMFFGILFVAWLTFLALVYARLIA